MEVAYYTVNHTIRRRNNVVDLAEYRARMERRERAAVRVHDVPVLEPVSQELDRRQTGGFITRAADFMDMLASAALTVSAFVAMCVAIFVMV